MHMNMNTGFLSRSIGAEILTALLGLLGLAALAFGAFTIYRAETDPHGGAILEIEGLVLVLIGVVAIGLAGVISVINHKGAR